MLRLFDKQLSPQRVSDRQRSENAYEFTEMEG